jgi:hypothetical protein
MLKELHSLTLADSVDYGNSDEVAGVVRENNSHCNGKDNCKKNRRSFDSITREIRELFRSG